MMSFIPCIFLREEDDSEGTKVFFYKETDNSNVFLYESEKEDNYSVMTDKSQVVPVDRNQIYFKEGSYYLNGK